MTYDTKDSGERQRYHTGAQRDTEAGKLVFTNIPKWAVEYQVNRWSHNPEPVATEIVSTVPDLEDPYGPDVRPDLIPEYPQRRLAALYGRGARKYDDHNWKRGINLLRFYGSMIRHAFQAFWGDTSEDHLAAVVFNAYGAMWTEREIWEGRLPKDLGDAGWIKNQRG